MVKKNLSKKEVQTSQCIIDSEKYIIGAIEQELVSPIIDAEQGIINGECLRG